MGRLSRPGASALAALLAAAVILGAPAATRAGGGFSALAADATFGVEMTFSASWSGAAPERTELLLGYGGEERVVVPVEIAAGRLEYRRDLVDGYVPPNTTVTYQWRAVDGTAVTLSAERTLLYDDDRAGLDWSRARIGSATVHWYGPNEDIARRFGDLAGDAADAAADLLGHPLSGPIDIFVYDERDEFFGAAGPDSREWTGAATYPHIRSVYMWLGAGATSYLETTIAHEVTHVVFEDATANPFHEPPAWLNEGTATWSELEDAATEEELVRLEARSAEGLMAFEALTDQFPIDVRGASLAYAQGATMVDRIVSEYGTDAMGAITEAYRSGATDGEAIRAGTGVSFDELRADYFASFGVTEPDPVEPMALGRSDVALPPQPAGGPQPSAPPPSPSSGDTQDFAWWLIIGVVIVGAVFLAAVLLRYRRIAGSGP